MTERPHRRVALFGTFDVENYGDLLFPLIARARLAADGIEVTAVSPTDARTRYRDAMPAIAQAEFDRDPAAFDALLIGGGNIVHLRDFALPGYAPTAYPALWAGSTAHAARHGLPVLWNAPGVLAPPNPAAPPVWLQRVVAAADHFTVRDDESAAAMERWSGRRPMVMPDTALDLPRVWPRAALLRRHAGIRTELGLPSEGPVVALHVKARSLGGLDVPAFAALLDAALTQAGARAILLAIGRCHGDHEVVHALQAALPPGRAFGLAEAERLEDIAAAIAGADAYLGASLHGQITAAAYDVPARLVTLPALDKFPGQARQMGRENELVRDWPEALAALPRVLAAPRPALPAPVSAALDGHWAEIRRRVAAGRAAPRTPDIFDGEAPATALVKVLGAPPAGGGWDGRRVDGLIRDGALDEAAAAIDSTLRQAPRLLPARLAQVRLMLARGESDRAAELSSELVRERPETPWAWLSRFQVLAQTRQHAAAVALVRAALERLAPGPDAATLVAGLNPLLPTFPAADQIALLQAALEAVPGDVALQIRLAMRAHANGDSALAIAMLQRAEESGASLPPHAARLKSQLMPLTHGMAAAADHLLEQVEHGSHDVETLCRLSRFAAAVGRFDLARQALAEALERHPLEWRSLYRLNRLFLPAAEDARIFDRLAALAGGAAPGWRLQFALFALRGGQAKIGREMLDGLAEDPLLGATARSLTAALDAAGPPAPRPGVTRDHHVRVVRQPGAKATLLLFGGFLGGLSHMPDRHLDALLARLPVHVVYLRDPHGRAYLDGIPELGPDGPAMHRALQTLVADLGSQRLVTLGGSAAGYAALRAGLALGADRVLSLAGFATPGPANADDPAHGRRGLQELFQGDPARHDLRPALRGPGRTRLIQVLGGAYGPDLARARDLEGIDRVELHVLPGIDTHHVALPAIADGTFLRLLEAALGDAA